MAKIRPYISGTELPDVLKYGVAAGELGRIAVNYRQMGWPEQAKYLKMAATLCEKVMNWRLQQMEKNALIQFARRFEHTDMVLVSVDKKRYDKDKHPEETIEVDLDDFNVICELAVEFCKACKKRYDEVDRCPYKAAYTRLTVPVFSDSPEDGKCPYLAEQSEGIGLVGEALLQAGNK